ncbi:MAG: site-specific integrase [Idiomarina sp.]|nr:site-specific integrase [Idiomarina sp.]
MAKLVISNDVSVGSFIRNGENDVQFTAGRNIGQLPTLYDGEGRFVGPVNAWFVYLVATKRLENLSSYARALRRYWSFLDKEQLTWNEFPPPKALKPTYRFRNDDLLRNAREGKLAYSTANTYMTHVVQFYLWAAYEGYYRITEKHKPFEIEFVTIKNNSMFAHMRPKFTVQTSDLRIRVPRDSTTQKVRGLTPLGQDALYNLSFQLRAASIEIRLICLLAIQCGLRLEEASGLTLDALNNAILRDGTRAQYEITIGPSNGVPTKYNKTRTIEVTGELLNELLNYAISERRINRLDKLKENLANCASTVPISSLHLSLSLNLAKVNSEAMTAASLYEPIFISQRGFPYAPKTVSARFGEIRRSIIESGTEFAYKFHDLRCTYATYRLNSLLSAGLAPADALALLMQWMGHNQESTTWKYLSYLKRKEALKEKISMLDQIMHHALMESAYE